MGDITESHHLLETEQTEFWKQKGTKEHRCSMLGQTQVEVKRNFKFLACFPVRWSGSSDAFMVWSCKPQKDLKIDCLLPSKWGRQVLIFKVSWQFTVQSEGRHLLMNDKHTQTNTNVCVSGHPCVFLACLRDCAVKLITRWAILMQAAKITAGRCL